MTEFDDCYHSCIESIYEKQFKCFPNPFITEDFVLLNSSQTKLSFCNKSENISQIDTKVCDKKCTKSCSQVYHTMSLDNKYYLTNSDSKIKIKFKSSQEFHYKTEIKETFVLYLSDIGGLISLWFGLSVIDLSSLIKSLFGKLKIYLMNIKIMHLEKIKLILNRLAIKIRVSLLFERINAIILRIHDFKWHLFFTVITIPILLYQLYELVDSYLQFSTEVSVDIISYRDSDDIIRYNHLPAITVCNDNIFEEILFNNKTRPALTKAILMAKPVNDFNESLFSLKSTDPFIKDQILFHLNLLKSRYMNYDFNNILKHKHKYQTLIDFLDVNDRQEFDENIQKFNNKSAFGLNKTNLEINLYKKDFYCEINGEYILFDENLRNTYDSRVIYYHNVFQTTKILSPFGKCFTYFYKLEESRYKTNLFLSPDLMSLNDDSYKGYLRNKLKLFNRRILFHSSDSLPVLTTEENFFTDTTVTKFVRFLTRIERFEFQRLPKPYDTNCQMYENRTRFQCLNECYFDGYMNSDIKCIPNSESLFTIVLNSYSTESGLKFCPLLESNFIVKLNSDLKQRCNKRCLEACEDIYYSTEYDETLGDHLQLNSISRVFISNDSNILQK